MHKAPGDYPDGKAGDVLTVDFTVLGIPCMGLNGGPQFRHSEAFSFQIATEDQEETDRYWNAIVGNGGQESECGWCKDRRGLSWQITPRVLTEAMVAGGAEAKRAFEAMMTMKKIDVARIKDAPRVAALASPGEYRFALVTPMSPRLVTVFGRCGSSSLSSSSRSRPAAAAVATARAEPLALGPSWCVAPTR